MAIQVSEKKWEKIIFMWNFLPLYALWLNVWWINNYSAHCHDSTHYLLLRSSKGDQWSLLICGHVEQYCPWVTAGPGGHHHTGQQLNLLTCSHASRKPGLIIVKIKSMNVSNIEENHRNSIGWWWENSRHLADCRPGWNAWTHPLTAWDQGQLGGVTSQATVRLVSHASSLWMPYKKMSGWHYQWIWAPWQTLIMGRCVLTSG